MEIIKKEVIHGFRCKDDGHIFKCENNKTGEISKYIKSLGYTDDYKNHIESIDIEIDMLCCPYCDYKTKDITNKTGAFTVHMKKEHNKSPIEVISEYPDYENVFSKQKKEYDNQILTENVGVTCKICGKKFKKLSRTHLLLHGLTPSEYEKKYGKDTTCSEYTKAKQSNASFNSQIDKVYRRIIESDCTPLFSMLDYHGVNDYKYKFKCNLCGCEFFDYIYDGHNPSCPNCKKYNRNH